MPREICLIKQSLLFYYNVCIIDEPYKSLFPEIIINL